MLMMWWPSCFFGTILRGFYSDMIGLKPCSYLGFYLVSILFVGVVCDHQTLMSYLQSRCGNLFFLPNVCIPGYHKFLIPVTSLAPEKQEEECIICYYQIKLSPEHEQELASQPPADPSAANDAMLPSAEQLPLGQSNSAPSLGDSRNSSSKKTPHSQPLIKKMKNCMVTPCRHYFHEYCLKKWFEKKAECPVCRASIKYYG